MNVFSRVVVEETIRRHVTHIGYVTYVAFLAILAIGVSRFGPPAAMWPTLIGLFSVSGGMNSQGEGRFYLDLGQPF